MHRQIQRLKPLLIFILAFTAGFYLFAVTLKYTFPFVAGFLLALLAQPLIRWTKNRLGLKTGVAAAIATLVLFILLFGVLFLLGYWLISEINNLVASISTADPDAFLAPLNRIISRIGEYLSRIDADFMKENQEKILNIAQTGISFVTKILSSALQFLTSLPAIFTMFIVMIFSTYFFAKDMTSIKKHLLAFLPHGAADHIRSASHSGMDMSGRYIRSYLLIYFITFLETLVVFSVLGVPYPLVLSIVTGFADILPVFGPGTIYIPAAAVYLFMGDYFRAGALFVCWLLITAIRQVIEPKLLSSSINIHPLSMLAAIYFALIAKNFWILIYFSLLMILYKIFTKNGTLPTLFEQDEEKEAEAPAAPAAQKQPPEK